MKKKKNSEKKNLMFLMIELIRYSSKAKAIKKKFNHKKAKIRKINLSNIQSEIANRTFKNEKDKSLISKFRKM